MDILLKNNQKTSDIRLDRVLEFDENSRKYAISTIHDSSKKLRSYTWRCNDNLDQGVEGACVGFALGHELISRPAEVKNIDYKFAREKIYWEAQKNDPWPGGSYPNASPRYEGTSVLAGIKEIKKLGYIEEYRWAFTLEDCLMGISRNGPAVLGIPWYSDMYQPDADNYIKPTGNAVGGHCIIARAINVKKNRVTLRNTWGSDWGNNGDCYITFEDLGKLLKQNGECAFLLKRKTKV